MPRRPVRGRPRASVLNAEKVLRCAIRLADENGIEALSMRTIAAKLGVEAMSLYNHVASKDDILNGIVDLVVSEIEVPTGGSDWRASMSKRAVSAHEVLLRHPWASGLIESRATVSPIRLKYADSVLGLLRRDGFSPELAYQAFLTLDSYIYGFTLQEVNWPFTAEEVPTTVELLRPQVPASEYPHVNEVMDVAARKGLRSVGGYDAEFAFGLGLILDGLENNLRSAKNPVDTLTP